jgi:two-component system CheB/CheR fusion protein
MGSTSTARGLEIGRSIFREANDAFFVFDPRGHRVLDVNPAALRLTGFERSEVLAMRIQDLLTAEGDGLQRLVEALHKTQFFHSREGYALARRSGAPIAINVSASRIHTRPEPLGLIVARDVSELRRTHQAREAAELASAAKNRLLASVSHELRTPLSAMLGLLDLVLDQASSGGALDPAMTADLQAIRRNGTHLARLIDDLLDLSRAEAGRLEVRRAPCRPREVVAEVLGLLGPAAEAKGLALTADHDPTLPEEIWTDTLRLQQILVNLVSNAVKYTEKGGVIIRVRSGGPGAAGQLLRFDVIDTGCGLGPEALAGLFQPFRHGNEGPYGAGLGLAISRKLAELLGGTIEVQSTPGRGSTFRLKVDVPPPDGQARAPARTDPAPAIARWRRAPAGALRPGCRILLAEDHDDNRRALSRRLQLAGADVMAVSDGLQATTAALAAAADGRPFDVILMDIHMPVTDGFEATAQLRAAGYRGAIIALTADARMEDREECLRFGCDDHLAKPVNWDQLLGKIEALAPADRPEPTPNREPPPAQDGIEAPR